MPKGIKRSVSVDKTLLKMVNPALLETLERICHVFYRRYFIDPTDRFTPEELRKWLDLRNRAIPHDTDGWFFLANKVLGYNFQEDVHAELFEQFIQLDAKSNKHFYDLSPDIKKVLVLWSRGTYKSTAVVVFIVACLLYDPDLFIMIISGNEKLSKRLLKEVKSHFETPTPQFAKLFPEYCSGGRNQSDGKLGNQSEFELSCKVNTHSGAPSCCISSGKSAKAGLHPDLLICDDIVNEQNYRTPALLERCWEEFQMLEPLVNPGGYTMVTGTRYSYGDTHEMIQEHAKRENIELGKSVWRISIKTCWKDGIEGIPMFDERIITHQGRQKSIGNSVDFLQRKRISMGDALFSAQYLNQIISSEEQTFTPALLDAQTFHWIDKPDEKFQGPSLPKMGTDFIVGDLAFVGNEKRDTTVFYVCRLYNSQIWVYDCVAGTWGTEDMVRQLWDVVIYKYRPQIVFLEKIPAHDSYDYAFRSYATQRGIQRYPIQWMQMSNIADAKRIRVGSVQTGLSQKRLWLYGNMPYYQELRTQLERWPKLGKHDDFADCVGLILAAPTGWYTEGVESMTHIPEMLRDTPVEHKPEGSSAGSIIVCG